MSPKEVFFSLDLAHFSGHFGPQSILQVRTHTRLTVTVAAGPIWHISVKIRANTARTLTVWNVHVKGTNKLNKH